MSVIIIVQEPPQDYDGESIKMDSPVGVYAIRFVSNVTPEKLERLMISLARQIRTRYEGFEDLTPRKLAQRLHVGLYTHPPLGNASSWPHLLGRIYRRNGQWSWSGR